MIVISIGRSRDISPKMYFDGGISQGYGVGSSGALVAAIYDQYAQENTVLEKLLKKNYCQKRFFRL